MSTKYDKEAEMKVLKAIEAEAALKELQRLLVKPDFKAFLEERAKDYVRFEEQSEVDARRELASSFLGSLKAGLRISRRTVDVYTAQDNDPKEGWVLPKHVCLLRLNENGELCLDLTADGGEVEVIKELPCEALI